MTAPATTVGSSSDDTSSSGDSGVETTGGCSCEGEPIGIDDEVDGGFRPSELLAATVFADALWVWPALDLDPSTLGSGGGAYGGGEIWDEVGGCCGNFICVPCPAGVTMHGIELSISTTDGRLDHAFTGRITGPDEFDGDVVFESEPIPFDTLGGTIGEELAARSGFIPQTVHLIARWQHDDPELALESIELWGEDGDSELRLGYHEAP
jgi:hypothetical protein